MSNLNNIKGIKNTKQAITHAGKFHADDVFSAALLKMLYPEIEIIRTFEMKEGFDGIVFDIGGGEFDHHQEGRKVRENGIPYAAFGLLWEKFGEKLLCREEVVRFDERFIQPLDEDDNTGSGSVIGSIISTFNPSWDSKESYDDCFFEAVDFAKTILTKKFKMLKSLDKARELVLEAYHNSTEQIVILPKFAPWKMTLVHTDAEFVIYPSQRGGYNAQSVPIEEEGKETKFDFPKEWAGKTEEELPRISGIMTLKFCHNSQFLISTDTLEDAITACQITKMLWNKN